jgi:hypothetical protein
MKRITPGALNALAITLTLTAGLLLSSGLQASPPVQAVPVLSGLHTIRQVHTGRFLDGHLIAAKNFAVVTRPSQDNATQRWYFTHVGHSVYTIQHQATALFLDAHDTADRDFAVVTRLRQNNTTQRWRLIPTGNNRFVFRQQSTERRLDAHGTPERDFAAVTRPAQNNTTQQWAVIPIPDPVVPPPAAGTCTIAGTIIGRVEVETCSDPKCDTATGTLRDMFLSREPSSAESIRRPVTDRRFVFANVQAAPGYTLRAPTGWIFRLVGGPVRCEPNRTQRLDVLFGS